MPRGEEGMERGSVFQSDSGSLSSIRGMETRRSKRHEGGSGGIIVVAIRGCNEVPPRNETDLCPS